MLDNVKLSEVMKGLGAIAATLNTYNNADSVERMYELSQESLKTEHERDALKQGTLAICASVGGMKIREKLHTMKFKQACKKVVAE